MQRSTPFLEPIFSQLEKQQNEGNLLIAQASRCNAESAVPLVSDEIFEKAGELIANSKFEVCMQFYKFSVSSKAGKHLVKGLLSLAARASQEKPKEAVMIHIILNSRGPWAEFFYRKNSINGLEELARELNNAHFRMQITYHPTAAFGTFHSKMIIIDNEFAILSGGDPDENNFQLESAVLLKGSAVACIREEFKGSWQKLKHDEQKHLPNLPSKIYEDRAKGTPCIFISKKENGSPITRKYLNMESPYKIAFLLAIDAAIKSIKILTSNLNDPDICHALARASRRGLDVKIVMAKYRNEGTEKNWGGTNVDTMSLLASSLSSEHKKFLSIRWATNPEGKVVKVKEQHSIHGKFACIDDRVIFMGSTPLDKQAMYYSREADVIFDDAETAKIFVEKIFADKFTFAKDFYLDLFEDLFAKLELEINNFPQLCPIYIRQKVATFKTELRDLLQNLDHPDVENHLKFEKLLKFYHDHRLPNFSVELIANQRVAFFPAAGASSVSREHHEALAVNFNVDANIDLVRRSYEKS